MQSVVKEAVLLVPHTRTVVAEVIDGVGDVEEMLPELAGHIFVSRVVASQLQSDGQEIQSVHGHPASAISLLDVATAGQRIAAIEETDIVEAQESALEDVLPLDVFAVHPPGEIEQQLVKNAFEEGAIGLAMALLLDLVDTPGRPRMNRRIDVAEIPLVGGQLAIGVEIPFADHQSELIFGKLRIHQSEGKAMEGEIPGGIPGVLPFIGHRDDVGVVEE